MSTELKNTLFRFVTMRAPELLTEDAQQELFVRHPEAEKITGDTFDSVFLGKLYQEDFADFRNQALNMANDEFTSDVLTDRTAVKASVGSNFYKFADWLTRNRQNVTLEQTTAKITGLSPLSGTKRIELWDNLFALIFRTGADYAREAILSALVADYFLQHFNPSTDTVEKARKLAQARVVIPQKMFSTQPIAKQIEYSEQDRNTSKESIKKAILKDEIEQMEALLEDFNNWEALGKDFESAQLALAKADYESAVTAAYASATKVTQTYVDSKGITRKHVEYEDLELPEFSFTPIRITDLITAGKTVSEKTTSFFQELKSKKTIQTFQGVKDFLNEQIKIQTGRLMQLTNVPEKMVSLGGTLVPEQALSRPASSYSITKAGNADQARLVLSFKGIPAGIRVTGASIFLQYTPQEEGEEELIVDGGGDYSDYWVGDTLNVELFNTPGNYFTPNGPEFIIGGRLRCNDDTFIFLNLGHAEIFSLEEPGMPGLQTMTGHGLYAEVASAASSILVPGNVYGVIGDGLYIIKPVYDEAEEVVLDNTGEDAPAPVVTTPTPTNGNVLANSVSKFGVTKLGIADYRRVEQEVCCYVPGEVSHIENVMAREYKEKSSRSLRRSEISETASSERESEKLTDTTTADRFEMNQEAQSVISEQTSIVTSAFFDGHYSTGSSAGMSYNFGASADFAHNVSEETSNMQAISQAKEITARALDRVVNKIRNERSTKMIEEYEENNKHGFDNRKGSEHVSGVFRWVDKIYRNRIVNYGKRLMYEFMIPEPATFHKMMTASLNNPTTANTFVKPVDPRTAPAFAMPTYEHVTEGNYAHWAALYNADVETMPKSNIQVGAGFSFGYSSASGYSIGTAEASAGSGKVEIPEGYEATTGFGTFSASGEGTNGQGMLMSLTMGGKKILAYNGQVSGTNKTSEIAYFNGYIKEVPVSYTLGQHTAGDITVTVNCQLTVEAKKQWKIDTFKAIIAAYEEKLAEYEKKVSENQQNVSQKTSINPGFYRQIENTTLRKNCLDYLISAIELGLPDLIADRGLPSVRAKYDHPDLDLYAAKVKFFEQAFEWDLMSYIFYPFFWAKKDQWRGMYLIENDDPLFKSFLQSGMARIILTVRPGFEEAVNWYMATGQIWNGGQVPTLDDPMYMSIVDELQQTEGTVEGEWESRVPTSLTIIQAGSLGLKVDQALPCDEDCHDFLRFDSDGNPTDESPFIQQEDEDGNPIQLGNVIDAGTEDATIIEQINASIAEIRDDIDEIKDVLNIEE